MNTSDYMTGLSNCIARAMRQRLAMPNGNVGWPQEGDFSVPVLRIQAFVESANDEVGNPGHCQQVASITLDLDDMIASGLSHSRAPNVLCNLGIRPYNEEEDHSASAVNLPNHQPRNRSSNHPGRFAEDIYGTNGRSRRTQPRFRDVVQRKNRRSEKFAFQPSSLDKLIVGIWEQIHGSLDQDVKTIYEQFESRHTSFNTESLQRASADIFELETLGIPALLQSSPQFNQMNILCRKVTQASQACRSIEIIVQARWTEIYEDQIRHRIRIAPGVSVAKHRKAAFAEACRDFDWSEKELRNRMAIWRGYKEIKDAAGWVALVFAGIGIYRYCKYRVRFDDFAETRLQGLQKRFEVAADTLHPSWRQLLSIVGESTERQYTGGPQEWVVFQDGSAPVPLTHVHPTSAPVFSSSETMHHTVTAESLRDCEGSANSQRPAGGDQMPGYDSGHFCSACGQEQSDNSVQNSCSCFPQYFGCTKRKPAPVQIFCTRNRERTGLLALIPFEYNAVIGEFDGFTTAEVEDQWRPADWVSPFSCIVRQTFAYVGFVNHSNNPNAALFKFTWRGKECKLLLSKGVNAEEEITIDYNEIYCI